MPDHDHAPSSDDDRLLFQIAGWGVRLAGAFLDGLAALVISYVLRRALDPHAAFAPGFDEVHKRTDDGFVVNEAYFVGLALPLVLQAVLIHRSGQSLGKLILGTRIVDEEGRTAGLYQGFMLRTLPISLLGLLPALAVAVKRADLLDAWGLSALVGLVGLVDSALIFSAYHRTLHDRIAGTYVCVVGTQRASDDERRPRRKKKGTKRKAARSA